ncbi:hypothetical protein EQG64_20285 [Streptomyces sp. S6]|nr:hypothetical protein EQG64_20285 [Streptomyces sp. S6]
MDLEAGGLSTAYGLTGHEFVRNAVAVGRARRRHGGGIAAELAGRPSRSSAGRAFAVEAGSGSGSGSGSAGGQGGRAPRAAGLRRHGVHRTRPRRPAAHVPPRRRPRHGRAGPGRAPLAAVDDAEGKETKVDVQHNTGATALVRWGIRRARAWAVRRSGSPRSRRGCGWAAR